MSLLRRIEGARPGQPEQPQQPGSPAQPPKPPAEGPLSQTASPARDAQRDVRSRLQSRIINNLDPRLDLSDAKAVKSSIEEMFNKFIDEEGIVVTRVERQRMLEQIMDEILGFGPIQPLLNDDSITEIMVNGPFRTYVERKRSSATSMSRA
jgi:pilus assembly protein CpaF